MSAGAWLEAIAGRLRTDRGRRWLLRVLGGVGLVAVFYGLISEAELGVWLELAGIVLTTGAAAAAEPPAMVRRGRRRS